jgi:hypothetical protein
MRDLDNIAFRDECAVECFQREKAVEQAFLVEHRYWSRRDGRAGESTGEEQQNRKRTSVHSF